MRIISHYSLALSFISLLLFLFISSNNVNGEYLEDVDPGVNWYYDPDTVAGCNVKFQAFIWTNSSAGASGVVLYPTLNMTGVRINFYPIKQGGYWEERIIYISMAPDTNLFYPIQLVNPLNYTEVWDQRNNSVYCTPQAATIQGNPSTTTTNVIDYYEAYIFITMYYTHYNLSSNCSSANANCQLTPLCQSDMNSNSWREYYLARYTPTSYTTSQTQVQIIVRDTTFITIRSYNVNLPNKPVAFSYSYDYFPKTAPPAGYNQPVPVFVNVTNWSPFHLLDIGDTTANLKLKTVVYANQGSNLQIAGYGDLVGTASLTLSGFRYGGTSTPNSNFASFTYVRTSPTVQDDTPTQINYTTDSLNLMTYRYRITGYQYITEKVQFQTDEPVPLYPFGYTSGSIDQELSYQYDRYQLQYKPTLNMGKTSVTMLSTMEYHAPSLAYFTLKPFFPNNEKLCSSINQIAIDSWEETGIYSLNMPELGVFWTGRDLVYQTNLTYPSFNQLISVNYITKLNFTINLCDVIGNCYSWGIHSYYDPSSFFTEYINCDSLSVTDIVFEQNVFNVSNGPVRSKVYIPINTNYLDTKSNPLLVLHPDTKDQVKYENSKYTGYWDNSIKVYVIDFVVQQGELKGPINWELHIGGIIFFSKYNLPRMPSISSNTSLIVVSDGYVLGPLVSNISYSYNTSYLTFTFTFNTPYTLTYMEANLTSNIDPLPYKLVIDRNTTYTPNKSYTVYVKLENNTANQIFTIDSIITIDNNFNSLNSNGYINPLVNVLSQNSFPYVNPTRISYTSVPLTFNSIKYTMPYSFGNRTATFNISVKNDIVLSTRHVPTVYLDDGYGISPIPCVYDPLINTSYQYGCVGKVPYGFGGYNNNNIIYSIYGFMDWNNTVIGFTYSALKAIGSGSLPISPVVSSTFDSYSPITKFGGQLVFYGNNLDMFRRIDCVSNVNNVFNQTYALYSNYAYPNYIMMNVPAILNATSINCIGTSRYYGKTNNITVLLTGDKPFIPIVNVSCTSVNDTNKTPCSGHGDCTPDGCSCYTGWSGPTCALGVIIVENRSNSTTPSTDILSNSTSLASISLYSIRELDINSVVVREILLTGPIWTYENRTDNVTLKVSHMYSTPIAPNCTINATIDWFVQKEVIFFAGQVLILNPMTAKFSVTINMFPFMATLNYLQLVFAATINSNNQTLAPISNCGGESSSGGGNGVSGDDQYLTMKLYEKSLLARFQPYGVVDFRVASIRNKLISTNSTNQTITTLVGLEVPHFKYSAIIDPDYSLLINTKSSDVGGDCAASESKSGFGITKIIIISVCGAVGVSLIIGSSILIKKAIKSRREDKNLQTKLETMNR